MAKIKVHELAKELSMESKDVIRKLQKMGCEVKSHMSLIDDSYADRLRQTAKQKGGASKAAPAAFGDFVPKVKRIPKASIAPAAPPAPAEAETPAPPAPTTVAEPPNPAEPAAPPEAKPAPKPIIFEERQEEKKMTETPVETPSPVVSGSEKNTMQTVQPQEKAEKMEARPPRPEQHERVERPQQKPYPPRAQNQGGQKPPYQGQGQRQQGSGKPSYQGQGNRPPYNKDARPQPQGNRPAPKEKASAKFAAPVLEKPSANYRQEKKVFVKDIKLEKISENEKYNKKPNFRGPKGPKGKRKEQKAVMPPVTPKKIIIGESVVLGELAKTMGKTASEIIKKLFELGIMATINQELDSDTAIIVASEFGVTVEVKADKAAEIMEDIEDAERDLKDRPPVVTVMGHVDHGKTSLLDAIRKTNVIATEAGGITQHIGAYQVEIKGKKITFIDTPGHEAFTAMRARGAQITDISILVVAADDGVMPQTVEAINHSKAAGVPIIVAINKIDKDGANPDRVKQDLMEHGLVPEEWGGDTIMVPISAKQNIGIENVLEMILLVAEVSELKANPKRQARGTVIEAQLDKNRGPVATLLVQKGTLKVGESILAGAVFGKVKAMTDDKGRPVRAAGPSMPVEVLGFSEVPPAGEIFIAVKEDKDARLVATQQQVKKREEELRKSSRVSLDDLFKQIAEGEIKELNLIIKADVQGSIEALQQALNKLNTEEVKINVIHAGVGGITESDIMLASASNAIIIGFNVRPDNNSRKAAEAENVDIRLYRVIYDAIEDIKKAMAGLLAPEYKENIIGHAEVRTVFKVPKAGMIAGSYVSEGKITRNSMVRVIRDSIVINESKIESLRRFKDDVKEVLSGFECGIGIENFNDLKEGDIIEAYVMEEIQREL